jgi:cation:H+ antiporter
MVVARVAVLLAAVVGLWLGARTMVDGAVRLARGAGLSEVVIGLTLVAVGTSAPELVVSVDAALAGASDVAVGNVVGSNVFNVLGVVGVAAVVSPATVGGEAFGSVAWLLVVTVLAVAAMWTGRVLSRVEGGLFAGSEVVRWAVGLLG